VVRLKYNQQEYITKDIHNERISDIYAAYTDVYLTLSNTLTNQTYQVYLSDCKPELDLLLDTITLDTWLSTRGNTTLPTVASIPTVTMAKVRYRDVFASGFKAEVAHPSGVLIGPITDPDYTDIMITKPAIADIEHFNNHTLYSVNGMVHRGIATPKGILLRNGAKSIRKAKATQLGLYSFLEVGALSFHHIHKDNVFNPHNGGKLYQETWLKLDEPIGDRVPMLVMGGYLIPLSESFDVVSPNTVRVRPHDAGYIDKWLEGHRLLDLSSVAMYMDLDPTNPNAFNKASLTSDVVLREYFSSDHSFVVLVDSPNLHVDYRKLEYTGLNGRYYDNTITDDILVTTNGRWAEYLSFPDHGKWVVAIETNEMDAPMYHTTGEEETTVLDTKRESWYPYNYGPGYMMRMWREL
jgi:hypothetical protein